MIKQWKFELVISLISLRHVTSLTPSNHQIGWANYQIGWANHQIGAPQKMQENGFATHFKQKYTTGSYGVGI
jgi:hypothetical protein